MRLDEYPVEDQRRLTSEGGKLQDNGVLETNPRMYCTKEGRQTA